MRAYVQPAARVSRSAIYTTPPLPWKRLLLPTEHGSWSLTFEPLALGLLVFPSGAGAWIAAAVAAAFMARKPSKLAWGDSAAKSSRVRDAARVLALVFGALSTAFLIVAVTHGSVSAFAPLVLALPGVAYFAWCERTGRTRSLSAELIGTAVCSLPLVAMALSAGQTPYAAMACGALIVSRSLPTLLLVRTCLRRTRETSVAVKPVVVVHLLALGALAAFAFLHWLPWAAVAINAALALRAAQLLAQGEAAPPARQLGMIETAVGVVYISLQAAVLIYR